MESASENLSSFEVVENEEFKESRRNSPTARSIGRSSYTASPSKTAARH